MTMLGDVRPSFKAANATPEAPPDYGPDFTKTDKSAAAEPKLAPKQNQKNPPKPAFKLGQNKKMRSPVRKLTREAPSKEELSDLEKLTIRYERLGKMAFPFHPKFGMAVQAQAQDCALSWFELAENNDSVRRWVLAALEGGAWGGVIAAHTPLFLAVLPEKTLERFFLKGMGMFAQQAQSDLDEQAGMFTE